MTSRTTSIYSTLDYGADQKDREGTAAGLGGADAHPDADNETSPPIDSPVIAETNRDPLRRRIANPARGLRKITQLIHDRIMPPPTQEEIALMNEDKRKKLLDKLLQEEANTIGPRLSRALYQLQFAYIRHNNNSEIVKKQLVEFDHAVPTEDAHWFHVNMDKWPYGCNSDDLVEQKVINHLSRAVQHKVNVRSSPEAGIWFIVERASGMMGIPVHVPIADMWEGMPSTATGLCVPIGMTQNRKKIYDNIDDMTHVLVAGQTGGGKSTIVNSWIVTLAMRNTPEQLQLLLCDMKAGLEFQFYEDLPHLLKIPNIEYDHGIIVDANQVGPALHWLVHTEGQRRMKLIRAAEHRDIKSYNARRTKKLSRIVAIVDEWAQVRASKDGQAAEGELSQALALLRAVGIHVIIGTQNPTKDVLGGLARSNLPTRVAFSCSDMSASVLIVGDNSAMNLQPAGRCIFKRFSTSQPVQGAFISESHVKQIVEKIKKGEATDSVATAAHDVAMEEMLDWSLHENVGSLRYREVYSHFAHRGIVLAEIQDGLKAMEGKTVEINGDFYKITPGAGRLPRRLVAVTDDQPEAQPV